MLLRVTGILAVIIGATVFVYFSWAAHRMESFNDPRWPRPSPYPDRWLLSLNDYYDAKYPVTGSYIKLHGEWGRVTRDVTWVSRGGAIACVAGVLMLFLPSVLGRFRWRQRGFDVVVNCGGPAANYLAPDKIKVRVSCHFHCVHGGREEGVCEDGEAGGGGSGRR
jgi:hypothetical protein